MLRMGARQGRVPDRGGVPCRVSRDIVSKEVKLMSRDSRVSIKVTKEVKDQLEKISLSYGLTKSSLGAFIIGQWLKDNGARLPGVAADNSHLGVPQ